jgi:carbonic anhydrase
MDTRLVELLPQALNIKNGDVKMLKTAGALISNPYGSVMRSILVAVSLLKAEEVLVIGHLDCGMVGLQSETLLNALDQKGISPEQADQLRTQGLDVENWLKGCATVEEGVIESVHLIRNHPLFPSHIPVHGLTIDPKTGKLNLLIDGRESRNSLK